MDSDHIDSFGYPLCFPMRLDDAPVDRYRVEARALGGHQKEAVFSAPQRNGSWRVVSDEGPALGGTDLAPFPLGFWNAGLSADVLEHCMRIARMQGVAVDEIALAAATDYAFSGSFFAGTGTGEASPPRLEWSIASPAAESVLIELVRQALDASPIVALLRTPLNCEFALQVNGRPRPLGRLRTAAQGIVETDPLKRWPARPAPAAGWHADEALIERLTPAHGHPASGAGGAQAGSIRAPSPPARLPGEARRLEIRVRGRARHGPRTTRAEVFFDGIALSRFAIRASGRADTDEAPAGCGLALSGIAFCLMTQVLRYVEHRRLNLRALRLVQSLPQALALDGTVRPLSTHVFVHGDEPEDTMEALLEMSANTCYLHAALRARLQPEVKVNGRAI